MKASEFLKAGIDAMAARAAERDKDQERSMARTVDAFNALTGRHLSERDGWLFMAVLKIARATSTAAGTQDDYIDLAAYAGLAGESVSVENFPNFPMKEPMKEPMIPGKVYYSTGRHSEDNPIHTLDDQYKTLYGEWPKTMDGAQNQEASHEEQEASRLQGRREEDRR